MAPVASRFQPFPRNHISQRRSLAAVLLAVLLLPLAAGCLRVQASMGVSSNDRVSGRVVVAALPTGDTKDASSHLHVPDGLSGKVRMVPYTQDGYVGSQVFFDDLTFGEVQQLAMLSSETKGLFDLQFARSGDQVTLVGRVDLRAVPQQGSDIQFTVAFPARVATTNGTREGDSTVTWKLPAGDVNTIRAEATYADPNTRSFAGWAGIIGGITLAVAAIVAVLAYAYRNPVQPRLPGTTP